MNGPRIVTLREYEEVKLAREALSEEEGELLWRHYRPQIAVEPPTYQTDHQWLLTNQGYVGHIPLTPERHIVLAPKVALRNVFQMLEYAYRLGRFDPGAVRGCETLQELYESLARVLARRVRDRVRRGLYRAYLPEEACLAAVRGRIDLARRARSPWSVGLDCRYEEHTGDLEENQLLAWTLFTVARGGICGEAALAEVRRAYHDVAVYVTPYPFPAQACLGRFYTRLNQDYEPLHALCHFFLANCGATHRWGQHTMVPFLVPMPRLFEDFVAAWLQAHLRPPFELVEQKAYAPPGTSGVTSRPDLVLMYSGQPLAVLDTKFKTEVREADVHQVHYYADLLGCPLAVLVYPQRISQPLSIQVDAVRTVSLDFPLEGDLEANGQAFLSALWPLIAEEGQLTPPLV